MPKCRATVCRNITRSSKSAQRVFKQDPASKTELLETANGCKDVLEKLDFILAKYERLGTDREAGAGKKMWQRLRFGSKIEELGFIRGKLITYTSTISVLLDTIQLRTADRIETKLDGGFMEMSG